VWSNLPVKYFDAQDVSTRRLERKVGSVNVGAYKHKCFLEGVVSWREETGSRHGIGPGLQAGRGRVLLKFILIGA
jgi:hypothetical protein